MSEMILAFHKSTMCLNEWLCKSCELNKEISYLSMECRSPHNLVGNYIYYGCLYQIFLLNCSSIDTFEPIESNSEVIWGGIALVGVLSNSHGHDRTLAQV